MVLGSVASAVAFALNFGPMAVLPLGINAAILYLAIAGNVLRDLA